MILDDVGVNVELDGLARLSVKYHNEQANSQATDLAAYNYIERVCGCKEDRDRLYVLYWTKKSFYERFIKHEVK